MYSEDVPNSPKTLLKVMLYGTALGVVAGTTATIGAFSCAVVFVGYHVLKRLK